MEAWHQTCVDIPLRGTILYCTPRLNEYRSGGITDIPRVLGTAVGSKIATNVRAAYPAEHLIGYFM